MRRKWITEGYGGEPYEYLSITEHIVNARGVCRGRPTFKYTRIEPSGALDCLKEGESIESIIERYRNRVSREAIEEAQEAYLDGRLKKYNRNYK